MADAKQYAEWLVANQDKAGTPEFETVAQAYRQSRPKFQMPAKLQEEARRQADPTGSFLENARAGLGQMMTNVGRGAQQLVGMGNQEAIDEAKKLDAPLSSSGGGVVGNVLGQVGLALLPGGLMARAGTAAPGVAAAGRFMLAPPSTLGGLATGVGMGAAQSALLPTATGESRTTNMMIGGAAGGLLPALGMAGGGLKAAVEPLYAGGREQIVGRALNQAAGPNAAQITQRLSSAQPLVPGSQPTVAEVAESGGLAALQRAAAAVDPESYAARAAQQGEARLAALQGVAGAPGARTAAEAARSSTTSPMYEAARNTPIPKDVSDAFRPQIDNLMARPSMKRAVDRAKQIFGEEQIVLDKAGSVQGLQYVKQALDDMIEKASSPASSIGQNELRALRQTRGDLIAVLDEVSPGLRAADRTYAALSRPINQMQVGEELLARSTNPLTGAIQPQAYARNLSDDFVSRTLGRDAATLQNTMTPQQLQILGGVRQDLVRSVAARDLGRGPGSDTVQKLAMTNLMQRSGVPVGILNTPGLGRVGNWAYQAADEQMMRRLASAMLDPADAATLMRGAVPNRAAQVALERARMLVAPGILGGAIGLNAPQ